MTKLYDNALMTVSLLALVGVWGELVEAYHGVNRYGGNTAEIYAYRLMPYSPTAHTHGSKRHMNVVASQAAHALCAIVDEFCMQYECHAKIDALPIEEWCLRVIHGAHVFDHRCHVRIAKKEN